MQPLLSPQQIFQSVDSNFNTANEDTYIGGSPVNIQTAGYQQSQVVLEDEDKDNQWQESVNSSDYQVKQYMMALFAQGKSQEDVIENVDQYFKQYDRSRDIKLTRIKERTHRIKKSN